MKLVDYLNSNFSNRVEMCLRQDSNSETSALTSNALPTKLHGHHPNQNNIHPETILLFPKDDMTNFLFLTCLGYFRNMFWWL